LKDCRHITFAAASSDLALKLFCGSFGCFHQDGTKPQRASISSSSPVAGLPRIRGMLVVGATFPALAAGRFRGDHLRKKC
jgi:hypothetical protein